MYPGSRSEWSNGGVNSSTSPSPSRTRYSCTAAIARSACAGSPAPDRTAHDWAIESILHSALAAEPSGVPSSKKARRYQSPSQPSRSSARSSAVMCARQRLGADTLASRFGDRYERRERDVQEPAEPDALAACRRDRRGPCRRSSRPSPSAADRACRCRGFGRARPRSVRTTTRRPATFPAGSTHRSDRAAASGPSMYVTSSSRMRSVTGHRDVTIDGVRQPQTIVGDLGANSSARRRVPPVLHVSFDELMRGRLQDVFPGQLAPRSDQRDDVLQLVAEAVCAAGLIERRPRPHPAGQRLIDQPVVQHDVHRSIRRAHLDRSLGVVPIVSDRAKRCSMILSPHASDQVGHRGRVRRLAEQHDDFCSSPRLQGRSRFAAQRTDRDQRPTPRAAVARGRGRPAGRVRHCDRGTRCGRRSTQSGARRRRGTRLDCGTRCSTGFESAGPALRDPTRSRCAAALAPRDVPSTHSA